MCAACVSLRFIRGSQVSGASPSDVDVMVIGSARADDVYDACARVEQSVGRPVNATILTEEEFGADSVFLTSVRSNPTVPIIGEAP